MLNSPTHHPAGRYFDTKAKSGGVVSPGPHPSVVGAVDLPAALTTVPKPTPSCTAIVRQPSPCERERRISEMSTATDGRPSRLPLARALRRPALTRSCISDLSNSAIAPIIWNMSRPDGVLRSRLSRKLMTRTSGEQSRRTPFQANF